MALANRNDIPRCIFETPPCHTNHPTIRLSELAAKMLSPHGPQRTEVHFVPGSAFLDFQSTANDTLHALVMNGQANFTAPYLSLTAQRVEMLNHSEVLFRDQYMFVYKKLARTVPRFNPFAIIGWRTLLLIGAIAVMWKVTKVLLGHTRQKDVSLRISARSAVVLGLGLQLVLGYISSNVVLLFNQQSMAYKPFNSLSDVATVLYNGDYIPIVSSKLTLDRYFYGSLQTTGDGPFFRLQQSVKRHGKPMLADLAGGMEHLLYSNGHRPYILITKVRFLLQMRALSCDFDYFVDDAFEDLKVMYFARGISNMKRLTTVEIHVIWNEIQRYENIYREPKLCNEPDWSFRGAKPISVNQLQTIPWLMLGMSLIAGVVLVGERLAQALRAQRSNKEEIALRWKIGLLLEEESLCQALMDFYELNEDNSIHAAKEALHQRLTELARYKNSRT